MKNNSKYFQIKKINEDVPTNSTGPNVTGTNNDATWRPKHKLQSFKHYINKRKPIKNTDE